MLECCLSGRAQSDLVLASILRVVMAVMASQPQIGAADCRPSQASLEEKKLCICLLLMEPANC